MASASAVSSSASARRAPASRRWLTASLSDVGPNAEGGGCMPGAAAPNGRPPRLAAPGGTGGSFGGPKAPRPMSLDAGGGSATPSGPPA